MDCKNPLIQITCKNCHAFFFICQRCYRGQVFCNPLCRELTQKRLHREANARYQRSEEGRLDHRDRQRRYRARQKLKKSLSVTDEGRQQNSMHAEMTLDGEPIEFTRNTLSNLERSDANYEHLSSASMLSIGESQFRAYASMQTLFQEMFTTIPMAQILPPQSVHLEKGKSSLYRKPTLQGNHQDPIPPTCARCGHVTMLIIPDPWLHHLEREHHRRSAKKPNPSNTHRVMH